MTDSLSQSLSNHIQSYGELIDKVESITDSLPSEHQANLVERLENSKSLKALLEKSKSNLDSIGITIGLWCEKGIFSKREFDMLLAEFNGYVDDIDEIIETGNNSPILPCRLLEGPNGSIYKKLDLLNTKENEIINKSSRLLLDRFEYLLKRE